MPRPPQMESPWGHPRTRDDSHAMISTTWDADSVAVAIGEPRGGRFVIQSEITLARCWAGFATDELWNIVERRGQGRLGWVRIVEQRGQPRLGWQRLGWQRLGQRPARG